MAWNEEAVMIRTYADWLKHQPAPVREDALVKAGNRMAAEIESRWSGSEGCGCHVCHSAKLWREVAGDDD